MLRLRKHGLGRTFLDDLAGFHDKHPVRHRAYDGQIVRYEEVGQVVSTAKVGKQVEHLGAHRHVQRAYRFVKQDQFGLDDQRPRDGDPLALPARKFMDVLARIRRCQADGSQGFVHRLLTCGPCRCVGQEMEGFGYQPVDPVAGIEAAEGVLKDHLHLAPHGKVGPVAGKDRCTVERDAAALHLLKPQKRAGECRLATAAFPDKPKPFAPMDREAHVIDSAVVTRRPEERLARQTVVSHDLAHLHQGGGRR